MITKNLKKKLILGTAQIGDPYGFNNPKKIKIPTLSIKKLLDYAQSRNLNHLDTAESYNVKKNFLKKKKWIIDTKIRVENGTQTFSSITKKLNFFFKRPNISVETIYIHNPEKLLTKNGKDLFSILKQIKKRKLIKNIGISVYDTIITKKIIKLYNIDVIQLPYNIFDRRFEKIMKMLKKKKIKIYARSVFLQGSLLSKRKTKLTSKKEFKKLNIFSTKNKIDKLSLCLNFVNFNNFIDKVIIGADSANDLISILNYKKMKKVNLNNLATNKKIIIDPRKWSKT